MPGIINKPLTVNDGELSRSEWDLLRPSDPSMPLDELRHRYETDGYLFLKGLIPRADVLTARRNYFELVGSTGVLEPGTAPVEGIFNRTASLDDFPGIGSGVAGGNGRPGGESAAAFVDLALQAHYEEWYAETFCKHPALSGFIKRFSGWEEDMIGFKRTLLRNNIPHSKPIGVHYDQIFLRYGEPNSITAWVPMGDIALNGGGLIYLEDGVAVGKQLEHDFDAAADASGLSEEQKKSAFNSNMMSTGMLSEYPREYAAQHGRRWLCSAYEAGDVVLHNAYAIHASLVNQDPTNRIRLATDLRFCDKTKKVDTRWLNRYEFGDGV